LEGGESKLKFFLRGGVLSQGGKLHISGVGHLVYDLLLDAYVLLNQVNTKATPVNNAVPTNAVPTSLQKSEHGDIRVILGNGQVRANRMLAQK